jgi:hypothetical protein
MERFWSKVDKTDSCWLWNASKCQNGYGRFRFKGMARLAHRIAYELINGKIPDGMEIDHLCNNSSCVNPDHLEAVPHAENMKRLQKRLRYCKQGHEYTEENTYMTPKGHKQCKTCRKIYDRESKARKTGCKQ